MLQNAKRLLGGAINILNALVVCILVLIVFTEGAHSPQVRCLSPGFCAKLYRYPCNPYATKNHEPCGACIYGGSLIHGYEICFKQLPRLRTDPQVHKEAPNDDPDFTAVPAAAVGPSKLQLLQIKQAEEARDADQALDFLSDFAKFQARESGFAQRSDPGLAFRLDQYRQDQDVFGAADDEDDEQDQDEEEPDQFADEYVQSLLGRYQDGGKQRSSNNALDSKQAKMASTTQPTTTQKILNTKAPSVGALNGQQQQIIGKNASNIDFVMITLLTCLAVAAAVGVIVSIFCFVKIQKRSRSAQRFDYSGPGNGSGKQVGGSGSRDSLNSSAASAAASKLSAIFGGGSTVDKKLANNATLYHFEHHKKEMMAAESADVPAEFGDSDAESGDDNDENDYTVYECPGLAPTGEMQVDNPLFRIKQQTSQPPGGNQSASRVSPPVVVHGLPQAGSPKQ